MSYGVDFKGLGPLSQTTLLAHGHYQSIYINSSVGARLPETGCRSHGLHRHLRCCPTEWEEIEISMAERGLCERDERGLTTPVGTNGKLFNPPDTGI